MATITVTKIHCSRQQDISGKDEPVLMLAGRERWSSKMDKDDTAYPNVTEQFNSNIQVKLLERNDNNAGKDKVLNTWNVDATPPGSQTLTATSSGFHYTVYVSVK